MSAPTEAQIASARQVLANAAASREWEEVDDPSPLLDQLVPYASVLADAEGHRDVTLVLERELEL